METKYTILEVDGSSTDHTIDWPEKPSWAEISKLLREIFGRNVDPEHVTVLHNNARTDLFVDEMGHLKHLPRNEAATKIYRNNWLTQYPKADPESLHFIVGRAVLFHRRIWF